MKRTITIFAVAAMLAVLILSVGAMSACGKQDETSSGTSTEQTEDTSVFDYEANDLSVYYKLASLDLLTVDAINAKIEKMTADATNTKDGAKIQLADGCTVEADYILYNEDMSKTLETGTFSYTLKTGEEPFAGLYSALDSSVISIGKERLIRTLPVPEKYGDESSVVLSITVKKVVYAMLSEDDYASPLEYYRNALLLEYNKSVAAADKKIENGDTVVTSYKLVSRADKGSIKAGDVIDQSDSFSFTVGAGRTLADFDSAFTGHAAGDSFTNEFTLPETYGSEDMHGLDITFECTVKSVSKPLNETTAKAMGYESLADFNEKTDAEARERYIYSTVALSILADNSQYISVPYAATYNYRDEHTYYRYYYLRYLAYYSSLNGTETDVDTLAKALYGFDTVQEYLVDVFNSDSLAAEAKSKVKDTLLLFCFIKAAGLDVSDEEFFEKYADDTAVIMGYDDAKSYYEMTYTCYGVTEERAHALLKTDFYRLRAEEYFVSIAK